MNWLYKLNEWRKRLAKILARQTRLIRLKIPVRQTGRVRHTIPAPQNPLSNAEKDLLTQVRQAHLDWVCAQQRFDNALDKDQIDYAVYSLEAAEKRYGMLLKQAKAAKLKADGAKTFADRYSLKISG